MSIGLFDISLFTIFFDYVILQNVEAALLQLWVSSPKCSGQYFRISCVKDLLGASTCYGWMPVRIRLAKYDRTISLRYSDEHPPAFLKLAGFQYFKRADRM